MNGLGWNGERSTTTCTGRTTTWQRASRSWRPARVVSALAPCQSSASGPDFRHPPRSTPRHFRIWTRSRSRPARPRRRLLFLPAAPGGKSGRIPCPRRSRGRAATPCTGRGSSSTSGSRRSRSRSSPRRHRRPSRSRPPPRARRPSPRTASTSCRPAQARGTCRGSGSPRPPWPPPRRSRRRRSSSSSIRCRARRGTRGRRGSSNPYPR
mmetsp:Transcript_3410/g.8031  ORF Transcript_3410/g.8031 Transcript_3410/m.8031 type:complete len:209 (-) Transcript_3410:866-1492(-)